MKKTIALILSLCMSLGFIVSTNRAFAVETSGVVNLDSVIASAPTNFVAGYLADWQYERAVANSTISINGTDPYGVIAMGYTGSTYLDETLKFTAKFSGTFSLSPGWDAFYLRSQGNGYNMPINSWSNDKYMFGFNNANLVTLYRVNSGAYTILTTVTLPAGVNLTIENQFEQCAVTNASSVDITLKVNGVTEISYSDTAANRITTAGYYGVAAYGNSSTITIGKPVVDFNEIVASTPTNFIAGYLSDWQYEKAVANSTISIKGTDPSGIIAMGYTGATYFNETLKINAKFAGTFATSPGWDAFYLRSQGNGYNMPINDWSNSKYMFGFDRTNLVTLYRVNGGAYTILATVTLPAGTNLTAENEYEQSAVTNLNSVDITLTVNGTSVISYSDTAANRITTAGYFGVAAYANDSTITLGKSSAPVVQIPLTVPVIDVNDYAGHYRQWLSNRNIDITTAPGYIKAAESETSFYHPDMNFKDASYNVTAKANFVPETWGNFIGFVGRCQSPSETPYAAGNKSYLVAVSSVKAYLYLASGLASNNSQELINVPCTIFADGLVHNVEFAIWDEGDTVRIVFNVDGNKFIDYSHTGTDKITTAGYFEGFASSGNVLTIGSGKNLETTNADVNLASFTVSPTKQISKVQTSTKVSDFKTLLNPLSSVGVTFTNAQGIIQSANYATTTIGTGLVVSVTASDLTTTTYTVVIYGDVDGTGTIDANDLVALKAHLLKSKVLTASDKLAAGDIFKQGSISIKDLLAVKKQILGLTSISQG